MNPEAFNEQRDYQNAISQLTKQLERAIALSHATTGIDAGERLFWASVLYTRICTLSVSILFLCPGSKLNPIGIHWDFAAIASLVRNAYELALTLHYLCFEKISEEEWMARLRVMQLHDCLSRQRMFRDFDPNDEQLPRFEDQANELRDELLNNPYFNALPAKQKKRFLRGETALMLIQDEILQRMGTTNISHLRGYYRFLSAQTHSLPLSFYRMAERGDGRGEETQVEKFYSAEAARFCGELLSDANDEMATAFNSFVNLDELKPYDVAFLLRKAVGEARGKLTKQVIIMPGLSPTLDQICPTCGSEFE